MRFMRFDRKSAYIADLTPIQAKRTRNVDGTDKLQLVTFDELDKGDRVVARDSMGRWCEWVVASSDVQRADSVPVCTANCVTSLSELSAKFIPDLRRGTGGTIRQALSKAIQGTRWTEGSLAGGTADYSFYHVSALDAVQSICDAFSVEAYATVTLNAAQTAIASRQVNLVSHRGSETVMKRFEYGRDLTDIRRTISSDDVVTRLYGYGKGIEKTDEEGNATGGYSRKITFEKVNGGRAYVEDASALQAWGIMGADGVMQHAEGVFEDSECEDPAKLLAETKAALKVRSTPTVSYEATVAALGRAGMDADGVDVGDAVQIVDTSFPSPLRLNGRVLEIEEDMLGSLADTTITLGNVIESARKRSQAVQQALDQLTGHASSWDEAATLGSDYLNGVIDGLNGVLNQTGGYVYLKQGQGLFVYDRPEDKHPTMCIQLGGGYFRIADGRKSDGTWDFRTLGNGHGLVADALYTGIIRGGSNSWNLTTGDLTFKQGSITINGPIGTQVRIDATNGFKIYQNGLFIGGIEIVDGKAYMRASRVGASSANYLTTGISVDNYPAFDFVSGGDQIMSVRDLTDEAVGLTVGGNYFLEVVKHYSNGNSGKPYIIIAAPNSSSSANFTDGSPSLWLSKDSHVTLALNDSTFIEMFQDRVVLQHDKTHYLLINSQGIQCRCGNKGFGWINGKFSDSLTWS